MGRSRRGSGIDLGSILGMFNFHNIITCKNEDNSMYCNIVKFFNLFFIFIFLSAVLYFIYSIFIAKKKSRK